MPERRKKTIEELEKASPEYSFAAESLRGRTGETAEVTPEPDPQLTSEQIEQMRGVVGDMGDRVAELQERVTAAQDVTDAPEVTVADPRVGTESSERIINGSPADVLSVMEEQRQREMERMQQELDASRVEREGLVDKLKGVFEDRPSAEETVRQERDALGVGLMLEQQQQTLNNIQNLQTRANTLVEQRDAAIGMAGQQAVSTPFITGHQNRIAENYDRRIATVSGQLGAETAVLQAQQGQVQQARGLISDIVDAQTYDTQMELQKMNMFLELNRDEIGMLDQMYQRELQESQRYWENQLNEEKQERSAVLELMLQYHDAGITPNDSLEEAVRKSSEWTGVQPDADVKELMMQYPQAGIEEDDSFAEAINKIAQIPQTPERPETFGGQQTGYYTWQYDDATGQWQAKQVVGPQPGTTTMSGYEPLNMVDVKRYNDMYPDAGVGPNDTKETANSKVYLEYEFKPRIQQMYEEDYTIEEVEELYEQSFGRPLSPQEAQVVQEVYIQMQPGPGYVARGVQAIPKIGEKIYETITFPFRL